MSDTRPGYGDLPPELNPRGPRAAEPGGRTPWAAPASTVARRTRGQRVAAWAAAVTSVCVLLAAGGFYAIFHGLMGNIAHINAFDALAKNGIHRPAKDAKAENFLLIGSDTRAGANGKYQAAKGAADYTTGQRSDTMMLVHVPSGSAKASVISFPRDSWVTVPAWTDTKGGHHPEHKAKLNAAFSEGGPPLLVATLELLSGIRVNHVVQIDFTGFKNMVNALGGLDVCVKTTRHEVFSGDNLTAGSTHHIDGDAALAFVRDRKGLPNQDLGRIQDQQYFLSIMMHKVLSAGTLTDPTRLYNFARAAAKSMTTDNKFGIPQMKTLAVRLRNIDPAHVTFLQVPILTSSGHEGGQSVVELDTANLPAVFAAMKDNVGQPTVAKTPTAAPTTPVAPLTVAPSKIRVRVSNGSGRSHLATQTAVALKNAGFTALTSGNATATATSIVYYGTGRAESARTVAAAVPGSVIKLKATLGPTLELVIGANFTSVVKVTVAGKSPPAIKPLATKPLTTKSAAAKTTTAAGAAAAVSSLVAKAPTAAQAVCAP